MKTDTFALMTPAGTQIVGTVDTIPASAAVSGFYESDDGQIIPEYVGDTEVYWDGQETATACGQPILMDENGGEWLERECRRVPMGAPTNVFSVVLTDDEVAAIWSVYAGLGDGPGSDALERILRECGTLPDDDEISVTPTGMRDVWEAEAEGETWVVSGHHASEGAALEAARRDYTEGTAFSRCIAEDCSNPVPRNQGSDYCASCLLDDLGD